MLAAVWVITTMEATMIAIKTVSAVLAVALLSGCSLDLAQPAQQPTNTTVVVPPTAAAPAPAPVYAAPPTVLYHEAY